MIARRRRRNQSSFHCFLPLAPCALLPPPKEARPRACRQRASQCEQDDPLDVSGMPRDRVLTGEKGYSPLFFPSLSKLTRLSCPSLAPPPPPLLSLRPPPPPPPPTTRARPLRTSRSAPPDSRSVARRPMSSSRSSSSRLRSSSETAEGARGRCLVRFFFFPRRRRG